MKRAVVTTAFGEPWERLLKVTGPRMEDYAKRTAQDFLAIAKPLTEPMQYTKSIIANFMALKGYEQITFFDADVLVPAVRKIWPLNKYDPPAQMFATTVLEVGEFTRNVRVTIVSHTPTDEPGTVSTYTPLALNTWPLKV